MVNSKKLLSLFLAVVMVFSALTVMASAYTRVETEGTADIDIKYTVEKVDVLPATDAGSAELAGDNFYAVTVWMKSAKPVDTLIVPFHYNKAHFSAITLSDGEVTYPYGAGMDQDTYYSEMGEGANYLYSLGDYMNNTGMYKANGTTATTKALAKCIGLGNANSEGISILSELVSPDHTLYGKWGAGLPANTGVMYAQVDCALKTKTAYLNTISGVETSTDWNRMLTLYFESITDEDVTGDEFGVFTDDCFTLDGSYDGTGSAYFVSATSYESLVPTMNVVSNAVIEAPAGPSITFEGTQARMADWNNYATATSFDAGIICQLNNKELTFDADYQCNEIDSIMIYLNGSEEGVPCYQVYKVDNSTWKFRLVINNVLKDSEAFATGDFSYKVVITFKDGTDAVEFSSTANFQTILADGIASYEANK